MKKILFLTILSLATTAVVADVGDNFVSIKLGTSNSNDAGISTLKDQNNSSGETTDNDLGNSDLLGIGIGKYFSETFRGEISVTQRNGFKYATTLTKVDGAANTTNKYKADVESLAIFVNGYFDSQPISVSKTSLTPYLGIGLGMSRNKMGSVDLIQTSDGAVFGKASSNTETEFAFKFALGALIELSDSVSMDINYQYVDLGDIKSGIGLTHSSNDMKAPFNGPEITSNEFNVGLQILF